MHHHHWILLAAAAALVLMGAGIADHPTGTDPDQLQARIGQLEAQVRRLEVTNGARWLTEQRADEIRSLVQDVLADADTRASLLQGATSGYDGGFVIGSADGSFLLKINGQLQLRFVYNHQDASPEDDNRWGFEMRRTKLKFKGHVVDPSWRYAINGAFSSSTGVFFLEDAVIQKDFGNGWSVRAGQYKPPFLREALVSSSKQTAVERSLINAEDNQDRSVGVEVAYQDDRFNLKAMYHNGFRAKNASAFTEDTEFAFAARGEVLLAGSWKQFSDFASWAGEDFGLLVGGALNYQRDEFGTATGPEETAFSWTVDASAEFGGANFFGAIVGRHLDVADADQIGFVVQGGVFVIPDEWELFGRYEWGDLDTVGIEDLSVLTVGVNRYWSKHALKWTTDVGIAFDEIHTEWESSGAGWRDDSPGEEGQIVVRSQLQLLF